MSILTDSNTDDDDGPGGGMLTPVYSPTEQELDSLHM